MWDISRPETFDNIPNLINGITFINKKNNIEVPIFIIQNKKDLKLEESIKSGKMIKVLLQIKKEWKMLKIVLEYQKMEQKWLKNSFWLY